MHNHNKLKKQIKKYYRHVWLATKMWACPDDKPINFGTYLVGFQKVAHLTKYCSQGFGRKRLVYPHFDMCSIQHVYNLVANQADSRSLLGYSYLHGAHTLAHAIGGRCLFTHCSRFLTSHNFFLEQQKYVFLRSNSKSMLNQRENSDRFVAKIKHISHLK